MTLEDTCTLSYYRQAAQLDPRHGVCLVQHTETGRLYVKKTADVHSLEVFRQLKEHPIAGIPAVQEVLPDGDSVVVIEEYIAGESLQQLLERRGTLPPQEAAALLLPLCAIAARLHGLNPPVVHRDIKPANIMISSDGIVKLIDLDAARRDDGDRGPDTTLMGTAGYAAPEQYGFSASTPQTDIYALGAVLNVMLTGQLPQEKPAAGALWRIIQKCTQMEPARRYPSVELLIADLSDFLDGAPVPDSGYALPGFRTRSPLKMAAAGIGYALLLLVGTAITLEDADWNLLWTLRILFTLTLFAVVLFTCNYRSTWKRVGLTRLHSPILRLLAVLAVDLLLLLLGFVLLSLTLMILINAA